MSAATATDFASTSSAKPNPTDLSHWISGVRVPGVSDRFSDVYHPASGQVQARVPLATVWWWD